MTKRVSIPEPLLQGIVAYLGTRPWREVSGFMDAIDEKAETVEEPTATTTRHDDGPYDGVAPV